jgi:hypothetical protein
VLTGYLPFVGYLRFELQSKLWYCCLRQCGWKIGFRRVLAEIPKKKLDSWIEKPSSPFHL